MELQIRSARGFTLELSESNISSVFEKIRNWSARSWPNTKIVVDELNVKVRNQLDKGNEINLQVKQLITEVQKQKSLRNEANSKVAELRKIRLERTNELKDFRAKLRSSVEKNASQSEKRGAAQVLGVLESR